MVKPGWEPGGLGRPLTCRVPKTLCGQEPSERKYILRRQENKITGKFYLSCMLTVEEKVSLIRREKGAQENRR